MQAHGRLLKPSHFGWSSPSLLRIWRARVTFETQKKIGNIGKFDKYDTLGIIRDTSG